VQGQTDSGTHQNFCSKGTGSFPAVKRPMCGADCPPPSSAEVVTGLQLCLACTGMSLGDLYLYIHKLMPHLSSYLNPLRLQF
jgi:hypothetical protein